MKTNAAFSRQLESRKEVQHIGSVGFKVYKDYFSSVDNLCLVFTVILLVVIGQIAISALDLFVSKWYVLTLIWLLFFLNFNQKIIFLRFTG